ncbi:hypothetical protein BJX76DRAFT_369405 [Aspergillus varians]
MFGPPSTDLPKPPVPYTSGWRFHAKSHTVPAPTLVVRDCCLSSENDMIERRRLSPTDRCLKRPPLPGREGNDTVSLEVVDLLKAGDGHNCQVLTVRLLESTSQLLRFPQKDKDTDAGLLVAKIYDPLYFDDDGGYLNPFLCMDKYYTHEANAYTALSELQGQWIPKYYGSYSVSLPVDPEHTVTRTVRMILIEHVQGSTMADTQPEEFSQSVRQGIMKSIVDLESRIYEKNLLLIDLEPRNVIVDFLATDLVLYDPIFLKMNFFVGEYISPLLRWKKGDSKAWSFSDWVDWDWDSWLEAEFSYTAASITPEMRERWPSC